MVKRFLLLALLGMKIYGMESKQYHFNKLPSDIVTMLKKYFLYKQSPVWTEWDMLSCVEQKDDGFLKVLLDLGTTINTKSNAAQCALARAQSLGQTKCTDLLVRAGVCNDSFNDLNKINECLLAASLVGHVNAIRCLIQMGAKVNVRDSDTWTPLMWATVGKKTEAVKALLLAGADVSACTECKNCKYTEQHNVTSWRRPAFCYNHQTYWTASSLARDRGYHAGDKDYSEIARILDEHDECRE